MRKLLLSAVVALSACGGGGDDGKPVASLWTRESDGATFDLRAVEFSKEQVLSLYTKDGVNCLCTLIVVGDDSQGSYALTSCIASPWNATDDKQCKPMNSGGNYTNTGTILTMTGQAGSITYR